MAEVLMSHASIYQQRIKPAHDQTVLTLAENWALIQLVYALQEIYLIGQEKMQT